MPASVAIVVEWENVLLSELGRAQRMLRQVCEQARDYACTHGTRFELLVVHNPDEVPGSVPEGAVRGQIEAGTWPGAIRFLAAPGLHCYQQKTLGAGATQAEVVVFLDSDVIPEPWRRA
ncbi:MAG: hypothetical protein AB1505_23795 [Candidatus Latescibacterota bacterium]